MGKKKSGQKKVSLNEFLSNSTVGDASGSWADEMDLPTAPAAALDNDLPTGPRRESTRFNERPAREYDAPPRQRREGPIELPKNAPYIAYVANLSYSLTEQDLRDFFGGPKVLSVRIPINHENQRPRGFAYVEFEDVDALSKALELNEKELQGRSVFVNVAEQKDRPEVKSNASQWRREAPIESAPPKLADTASQWRRTDPIAPTPSRSFGNRREFSDRNQDDREPHQKQASAVDSISNWRSGGGSSVGTSTFSNNRNSQPKDADPRFSSSSGVRKKLELLPRTKPSE